MRKVFVLFIILLSGCSVSAPLITDYRINPNVNIKRTPEISQKQSIKILPIFSNSSLSTNAMHYRVGKYKEYTFTQSAWRESPSKAITNKLVNILEKSELFQGVYGYKSSKNPELILEVSINEFIQSFNEAENQSFVTVDISFNLIEQKRSKFIASKNFTKTMQTKTLDAQGGVEALNELLSQVLEETIVWLEKSSL